MIILFLKAPRRGYVKTRLASKIGEPAALKTYKMLVTRQIEALPDKWPWSIHFAPADAGGEIKQWLGKTVEAVPQIEGDLGQKLAHAVNLAFEKGSQTVYCIGGDCPGLNPEHFAHAKTALKDGNDVVFGPTEDGGYYLVALKKPHPELFESIPWSTKDTLKASLKRARELNLKVTLLGSLYDIDTQEDLERAQKEGWVSLEESQ